MNSEAACHLLPLYFDGELDPAASREYEIHLDGCPDCQRALDELESMRWRLRTSPMRFTAPENLRRRISATASAEGTRRAPRPLLALALAASWLIAAVLGAAIYGYYGQHANRSVQARNQLAHDLFMSHWRALAAASPVDVASTDQHTVKPWFAGRIAESPRVRDFAAQGFPLIGGRIDYIGDTRVPVLVYRHGGHLIDVYVLPRRDIDQIPDRARENGYEIRRFRLGGASAAAVTDMDPAELDRFMKLIAADGQQTRPHP